MDAVLAVDVGGTKLAVGRVDAAGRLHDRASTPTPPAADAETLFATLVQLLDGVRRGDEVACGVGTGGPMRDGGALVSPLNIPGWRDFPLQARLADHLQINVTVDNDAKALALAEGWQGVGRGVPNFIGMVVSTGVGGGIVLDGRLLDGHDGNAGHIGHVIVEPDGRPCACGAVGCLEAEASGTAIAARTGRPAAEAPIEERQRAGRLVGRAVASVANLLDLQLAAVAGSVALGYGAPFFEAAQAEVDRSARLQFTVGSRVIPAGLGAEAPLVGAAAVALRPLGHPIL